MVLAVDIGNSNIVLGCFEQENILFVERISTNRDSTVLEYAIIIKTILELNGLTPAAIEGSIISSVVPPVMERVKGAIEKLMGKTPIVVGPGVKTGLTIRVENAAGVGSDRVVDAVAAMNSYPCPLIIVDMGTATTISVVDRNKNFIGGVIMPGLRISMDALSSRAAQLPHISLAPPKRTIGRSTEECMRSGIVYGCAATIDGIVRHIEEELGESCSVVATGGLSSFVIPHCTHAIALDEQLLLKGLMLLYRKNCR